MIKYMPSEHVHISQRKTTDMQADWHNMTVQNQVHNFKLTFLLYLFTIETEVFYSLPLPDTCKPLLP